MFASGQIVEACAVDLLAIQCIVDSVHPLASNFVIGGTWPYSLTIFASAELSPVFCSKALIAAAPAIKSQFLSTVKNMTLTTSLSDAEESHVVAIFNDRKTEALRVAGYRLHSR